MHRDVKPSNLLLCCGAGLSALKLTDFGMAKLLPMVRLSLEREREREKDRV